MTVKDLIDTLAKLPQDLEVFRAKDDEGNGFDPVYTPRVCLYDGDEHMCDPNGVDRNDYDYEHYEMVVVIW